MIMIHSAVNLVLGTRYDTGANQGAKGEITLTKKRAFRCLTLY